MSSTLVFSNEQPQHQAADTGSQYGGDLLRILKRRKWIIFGTVIVITGLAALFAAFWPATYKASSSLIIATSASDPRLPTGTAPLASLDDRLIDSQVELLGDRPLLRKVVKDLKLYENPEFGGSPAKPASPEAATARIEVAVDRLRGKVNIRRLDRSAVIGIVAESKSAETATRIANKLAAEHIVLQRREALASKRSAIDALVPRVDSMREQAIAADRAVATYRRENNLLGMSEGSDSVEIGRLSGTLADARSSRSAAEARAYGGMVTEGVATSPLLGDLQRQAAEAGKRVADLSTTYGSGYPELVGLRAQLDDLNRRISAETLRAEAQLQSEAMVNRAREGQISSDLGSLRSRSFDQRAASVRLFDLERTAAATNAQYVALLAELKQLDVESGDASVPARVLGRAVAPTSASFPRRPETIAVAFIGSLLLGLILAVVVEQLLDNRIRTAEQIDRLLGIPTLGMLPKVKKRSGTLPHQSLTGRPRSVFSEGVRSLYLDLRVKLPAAGPHVVVVTSPLPGEGKTTVAMSLASAAAVLWRTAVVVDFDLRRPGLLPHDGPRDEGPDLAAYLRGTAELDDILTTHEGAPRISLVAMHGPDEDPAALLASPRVATLLEELRKRFQFIVVNAPPILAVRDAKTLAGLADATLLVVRWNKTHADAVRAAARVFDAPFVGAVINQIDFERHADAAFGDAVQHHYACQGYYLEEAPEEKRRAA
nr:Wzz/FepE/Etk N-terminal domain-containing protein [Polymorphobacter sp.]